MFVSFPSLKGPSHETGPSNKHTGNLLVLADWRTVAAFPEGEGEGRPADWAAFRKNLESKFMGFFADKFPRSGHCSCIANSARRSRRHDLPATRKGGDYGIETTPRRMLSDAFRVRRPVLNLPLAGQDVMTAGIAGALAEGAFGRATVEPIAHQKLMYRK